MLQDLIYCSVFQATNKLYNCLSYPLLAIFLSCEIKYPELVCTKIHNLLVWIQQIEYVVLVLYAN